MAKKSKPQSEFDIINFDDFIVKKQESAIDFSDLEDYFLDLTDKGEFEISIDIEDTPNMRELDNIPMDQKYPSFLDHIIEIKSKDNSIKNWTPNIKHSGQTRVDFEVWGRIVDLYKIVIDCTKQLASQKGLTPEGIFFYDNIIRIHI